MKNVISYEELIKWSNEISTKLAQEIFTEDDNEIIAIKFYMKQAITKFAIKLEKENRLQLTKNTKNGEQNEKRK